MPPGMAGNSHGNSRKNGNPAAHLKDYQFKPGQSGNPEGRPRGTKEFAELIAKETRGGAELVEYALAVLRSKSAKAPKVWAVEYLTERMLGKAPQTIELSGNDPAKEMLEIDYTEAELLAMEEQAKQLRARGE